MAADSRRATEAVAAAAPSISAAVDVVCARLAAGGRLVYVGAGTAGRLAVLDAAELGADVQRAGGNGRSRVAGGERASAIRSGGRGRRSGRGGGAGAALGGRKGRRDRRLSQRPHPLRARRHRSRPGRRSGHDRLSCNAMSKLSSPAEKAIDIEVGERSSPARAA